MMVRQKIILRNYFLKPHTFDAVFFHLGGTLLSRLRLNDDARIGMVSGSIE